MRPDAVLLDSGGVFLLPDPSRVAGAFERAEVPAPSAEVQAVAHYRASARLTVDVDLDADWQGSWNGYLREYVLGCTEHLEDSFDVDDLHRHVDPEFADAALWVCPIDGAVEGLRELAATGVRLGVISNADGLMAQRLREREILQVGPGIGVEVECVIDSGDIGVMKPDPAIFRVALEAMGLEASSAWYVGDTPAFDVVGARRAGLRPWLMDPYGHHTGGDVDRVDSLAHLASIIASTDVS